MSPSAQAVVLGPIEAFPSPERRRTRAGELPFVARMGAIDEGQLFELLYEYQPVLVRLASILLEDQAVAQEVVQETWREALQGIAYVEAGRGAKARLFAILIKRARLRLVRQARSGPSSPSRHFNGPAEAVHLAAEHTTDGQIYQDKERIERQTKRYLRQELERLPVDLRLLVWLRDVEGLDSEEVRRLLGMAEATQTARLRRARSRLTRALDM